MRAVIARFPDYDQSPAGLEALIMTLKEDQGIIGAANVLGFSRSTISYWLRKLAFFRQFAGQSPEALLRILADIADEQGLDVAAKLICVDPKTLNKAISKLPIAA
jgi:hypothetical protein